MADRVRRKLTTILAADAAGYSSAMEADEVGALADLRAARRVFVSSIERHDGRVANTAGDGLIAEFPSVVEAVTAAVEIQRELDTREDGRLRFRIGIHLGDVLVDGDDLLGEGVNLAARLQAMAEPGGILVSQPVYDQVHAKLAVGFENLGGRRPRNFSHDVTVYRVHSGEAADRGEPAAAATPPRPQPVAAWSERRGPLARRAGTLAVLLATLAAIALATGGGEWARWAILGVATAFGLEAAPLLARGWLGVRVVRGAVLIAALAVVNAYTWGGYPWAVWPAGALLALWLLRSLGLFTRNRRDKPPEPGGLARG